MRAGKVLWQGHLSPFLLFSCKDRHPYTYTYVETETGPGQGGGSGVRPRIAPTFQNHPSTQPLSSQSFLFIAGRPSSPRGHEYLLILNWRADLPFSQLSGSNIPPLYLYFFLRCKFLPLEYFLPLLFLSRKKNPQKPSLIVILAPLPGNSTSRRNPPLSLFYHVCTYSVLQ